MGFFRVAQAFEECNKASGRNAKIAILDKLLETDEYTFAQAVEYAKNPKWIYHLKHPTVWKNKETGDPDKAWAALRAMLDKLRDGIVPANSVARSTVKDILESAPGLCAKWMGEVLDGSLKMGIQNFDRWFPGLVPASPVMLCEKWDGEELTGDWIIEPKFDGYRAAVVVDDKGNCRAISRGDKEFWNWQHIAAEIKAIGFRNVVLDGEFYARNFGLTSSVCKTQKVHPQALALKYHVFDLLTKEEWDYSQCNRSTAIRQAMLQGLVRAGVASNQGVGGKSRATGSLGQAVVVVRGQPVHTVAQIEEAVAGFYALGYEGGVLKNQAAGYTFGRSCDWLKIKPQEDADLAIVDALEGKGRHVGRLGAFIVAGDVTYKKKLYSVRSRVGGGLKDEDRQKFWKLHKQGKLVGTVIEIVYQDVTVETSMGETCTALRFPRFIKVRDDK